MSRTACKSAIATNCNEDNCWRMGLLANTLTSFESLDAMAESIAYSVTVAFNDKETVWNPKTHRSQLFHLQKFIRQSDSSTTVATDDLIKTQMAFLQSSVRDAPVQQPPMTGDDEKEAFMYYLEQRSIQRDKKKRDSAGEGSSRT